MGRAGVRTHIVRLSVGWCRECIGKVTALLVPFLRTKLSIWKRPPFTRYASPEEEALYWKASTEAQNRLSVSNANTIPADVPLVRYYVPKLLPRYRDTLERSQEEDGEDYRISTKVVCKWHRMVFRGPVSRLVSAGTRVATYTSRTQRHPTLREAEKLMKNFSSRDRREMRRIAKMLTDEEVFVRKAAWTSEYRDIWRRYLDTKGPDIVISFE